MGDFYVGNRSARPPKLPVVTYEKLAPGRRWLRWRLTLQCGHKRIVEQGYVAPPSSHPVIVIDGIRYCAVPRALNCACQKEKKNMHADIANFIDNPHANTSNASSLLIALGKRFPTEHFELRMEGIVVHDCEPNAVDGIRLFVDGFWACLEES